MPPMDGIQDLHPGFSFYVTAELSSSHNSVQTQAFLPNGSLWVSNRRASTRAHRGSSSISCPVCRQTILTTVPTFYSTISITSSLRRKCCFWQTAGDQSKMVIYRHDLTASFKQGAEYVDHYWFLIKTRNRHTKYDPSCPPPVPSWCDSNAPSFKRLWRIIWRAQERQPLVRLTGVRPKVPI